MYLVYINELGPDYKNERIYELIFSDQTDTFGDDWDLSPASGRPKPPEIQHVKKVETLSDKNLVLELAQDSDTFSMMDAVDQIIAIGWESYDADYTPNDEEQKRLVFRYGDEYNTIVKKLRERKIKLKPVI